MVKMDFPTGGTSMFHYTEETKAKVQDAINRSGILS
jgi:hypothetical protein